MRPFNLEFSLLPEVVSQAYDLIKKVKNDVQLKPSKVPIYKGMPLYLTKNVRKQDDYCNGMLAWVEGWSDSPAFLRVRTRTGKRLMITPWTDVEHGNIVYYPIRIGFASTVHKILGDEVKHITIWIDTPGMPGVGYTALSRVEYSTSYSLGATSELTPAHFTPVTFGTNGF